LVLGLRLGVQRLLTGPRTGDPGAEPDRELAGEDERGDRQRCQQLLVDQLGRFAGGDAPERRLEELPEKVPAVRGCGDEQPEDDPLAPATPVDESAEQPEREEEDDDGNPERPRRQRRQRFGADVLTRYVAGEGAESEDRAEIQDGERDGRDQSDRAGGAAVTEFPGRLGS